MSHIVAVRERQLAPARLLVVPGDTADCYNLLGWTADFHTAELLA